MIKICFLQCNIRSLHSSAIENLSGSNMNENVTLILSMVWFLLLKTTDLAMGECIVSYVMS